MNSKKYIEEMTNIQQNLLEFIDDENDKAEEKFKNFKELLLQYKIQDNQHELRSFLYLLREISNNHHRIGNFFGKIDQILELFKDDLKKNFSNLRLFNIFKSNKRILLFLFEKGIITLDRYIVQTIAQNMNLKYPEYFQPEIKPFVNEEWFLKYDGCNKIFDWVFEIQKEIPENFYERRKTGENESFICQLIRKDLLDDFIVYVNENNYQLDSIINLSIYETNSFLLQKEKSTLIEYAAFFGSIKIFNYLRLKNVSLTPSLWDYAVHSNNAEIIQILEENILELSNNEISITDIFKELIKCYHSEIAYYIQNNFTFSIFPIYELIYGLEYYNFNFIHYDKIYDKSNNELDYETICNVLCGFDYLILLIDLLNTKDIDMNEENISKNKYFHNVKLIII